MASCFSDLMALASPWVELQDLTPALLLSFLFAHWHLMTLSQASLSLGLGLLQVLYY
jgi:hypothetical protein